MIAALLSGRKESKGLTDKNIYPLLGRPLMWYPLAAALHSRFIDQIYVSTDSEKIAEIAKASSDNVELIPRPAELATDQAHLADVIQHGFTAIKSDLNQTPELLVILLCNAVTVSHKNIDRAIRMLKEDKTIDSVATVSLLNQYSPVRAKKIIQGRLVPAVDIDQLGIRPTCARDCMGDIYFCDASLWVIRPSCMDYSNGQQPFPWMGQKAAPIVQQGGLDVDDREGLYLSEQWLRRAGFTETKTPY